MLKAVLAIVVTLVAIDGSTAVRADQQPPAKTDCSDAEFRQFDFWLGSWNVVAQGKPAGSNRIESAMKGCALIEHWTSASGGHGTSLNFYDRQTKQWSQAWIDEAGNALHLRGGLREGRMVLQSDPLRTAKGPVVHRITWSKEPNGAVRQLWESSTDHGKTWAAVFDGRYVRQ